MIRRATAEDADAVGDVFLAARASMTYLPSLHRDEAVRAWLADVVLPSREVWVAEEAERVVGLAAMSDEMLDHLYIHPDAQRRGVGASLLEHVMTRRPSGFRLWVFQQNDGARRFYERHGLRAITFGDGSGNEERVPDVQYEWAPTSSPASPGR